MRLRRAAFSTAALLALGACTDVSAPEQARTPALADLNQAAAARGASLQQLTAASIRAADLGRFDIEFKFLVAPTEAQRAVFEAAADRWQQTIVADVPSVVGTLPSCFANVPPVSTTVVDDIVIEVVLQQIDGPGKILGSAGPCYAREEDDLPVSGVMYFDTDDLAYLESLGLFDEVIVHEMGHVLGIGSLWSYHRSLLSGTLADPYFAGQYGNMHWQAEGGTNLLPIENSGGPGTALGHWRESVLRNELMTGYLNLGDNPLSRITAGSLRDMGYGVGIVGEQYALQKGAPGVVPTTESISSTGVNIATGETVLNLIGTVPKGY